MELSAPENRAVYELAEKLKKQFGAKEVILYGSAARGDMDEGSDIDLLIILDELDWEIEKKIIKLCFDAQLEYGRVFSAVCYTVYDLRNSPLKDSPLVLNAKKQGIRL